MKNLVTVHSVHSNVAKIHSRLPAAMEFWLVCLGILVVLVAVFAGMAEVDLAVANDHELDIKSTMMYRHDDYIDGIRLVNEGKVHLKPLISKTFAFKDYLKAYQYIDDNRETTMKVIINVSEK